MTVNKREAVENFKEGILPHIPSNDKVAIRCAWNDYVDGLNKDGQVTDYQARTWSNPYDRTNR
jgi:hypothetical protein